MPPSFNLLDEPFIPVYTVGGRKECSIKETLATAHDIAELYDASPISTLALHRLLLAIVHRNLGPSNARQWVTLWQAGRFDTAVLDPYFVEWHDRFDLFAVGRPFFQDAAFSSANPNRINQLVRERARGHNAMLFDHTSEDPPPLLEPAEAARALIAEQAFAIGSGRSELGYTTSAPLIGGVAVLLRGDNLFETLLLNLVVPKKVMPYDQDDAPAWERNERPTQDSANPHGYLDYLTWQSRSIHLHPEENGRVRWMSFAQGRKLESPSPIYDPMMAYRREKDGDRPIRLSETKALWRESAALFAKTDAFRQPATLHWLGELQGQGYLPRERTFSLSAIGLCTDKAKVNFWQHETYSVLPGYLTNLDLVKSLDNALQLAEEVGSAVRLSTKDTAALLLAGKGWPSDSKQLWATVDAIGADALYWSWLEEPFRQLFLKLPGEQAHQKQQMNVWFRNTLQTTACRAFEQTTGHFDNTGHAQYALVIGEQHLGKFLAKIAKKNNIESPGFAVEIDKNDKPAWVHDFVSRLKELAESSAPNRAILTELRRRQGDDTGRALNRVSWLFHDQRMNEADRHGDPVLVACLFAMHWKKSHRPGISLGTAMRRLLDATGTDSITTRFMALLDCEREDLDGRLRQVIALLHAKGIELDWQELLWDLSHWDSFPRRVQRRWARDFWCEGRDQETNDGATLAIMTPVSA